MQQRNVRLQYSTVVTLLAGVFGGCGGCLIGQLDERTVALPSRRRTIPMFILPINERIFRTTVKIGQTNTALIVDSNGHRGLLHHTSACDWWHNPQSLLIPAANGSSRSRLRETSFKHISSRCWKNCPNRTRASAPKVPRLGWNIFGGLCSVDQLAQVFVDGGGGYSAVQGVPYLPTLNCRLFLRHSTIVMGVTLFPHICLPRVKNYPVVLSLLLFST